MSSGAARDVNALIALIDRWLLLTGVTYTIHQAETTVASPLVFSPEEQDSIPLFVHRSASLSELLRDQEREVALTQELSTQIKSLCCDKELVRNAQIGLVAEFANLSPPPTQLTEFARCHITKQVAILRKAADQAALPPAFEVLVVNTIQPNGQVDDITTIYPLQSVTWLDFIVSLKRATASWQSSEAGFPSGYGLQDGGWLYQHAHKHVPAKPVYPLNSAAHFEEMYKTMAQTDTTVLIWHERIYKISQARKKEHEELRDRRSVPFENEPLNPDGTTYFEPFFDDYDRSGIDFSEVLEEHRRTFGLPEWQSDNGEDTMDGR